MGNLNCNINNLMNLYKICLFSIEDKIISSMIHECATELFDDGISEEKSINLLEDLVKRIEERVK